MMLVIALRELRSLFLSPLAWVILAVLQLILGFLFLVHIDIFIGAQSQLLAMASPPGVTEVVVAPLFSNAAIILLLAVPLMTMRLVAEERRNRSLPLLLSAPVTMIEIVLGKFLGIVLFLLVVVALITLMPLSLLLGGTLDFGLLAASALGLVLLLAAFAAIGLFMSAMSQSPTVAAFASFGFLLLLWIVDWSGGTAGAGQAVLRHLSLINHYEPFLKGVFDSADLLYYALFIILFLALAIRRLDADRIGA